MIPDIDWRNLLSRAGWTVLQAFLAVLLVQFEALTNLILEGDWEGLKAVTSSIIVGLIAGLFSSAKTLLQELKREIEG